SASSSTSCSPGTPTSATATATGTATGTRPAMGSSGSERRPPGLSDEPHLSLVIVNWNAGAVLADCLLSLEQHPPTRPCEAVVVDNYSYDSSVKNTEHTSPKARLLD